MVYRRSDLKSQSGQVENEAPQKHLDRLCIAKNAVISVKHQTCLFQHSSNTFSTLELIQLRYSHRPKLAHLPENYQFFFSFSDWGRPQCPQFWSDLLHSINFIVHTIR
jgi:hypothetical protein